MPRSQTKITALGGGTGNSIVLSALKDLNCELSTIVNVTDNGGSSGRLRKKFNVLPPGDIRQCLIALSDTNNEIKKLFNSRFEKGNLKGHAFGNIFLTSLEKSYGNIEKAIEIASRSLNAKGNIVPATLDKANLCLKTRKKIICGEHEVYGVEISKLKNFRLYLKPKANINPRAEKTVKNADFIIFSPGNLYCSIVPILLIKGMAKAIEKSKAKIIYISPLANLKNHTNNFYLEDYIDLLQKYLNRPFNYIIYNKNIDFVGKNNQPVLIKNNDNFSDVKILKQDFVQKELYEKDKNDALARTLIRHNPAKLTTVLRQVCGF